MTGNISSVRVLHWPECPLLVVFAEKGFSELITADHDGAGWSHFDQPRDETCKQSTKPALRHNLAHHAEGGGGGDLT